MPPGIVNLTLVSGRNPEDGVNVAVAPDTCQLPAIFGEMDGNGVLGERAEENVSVIGPPPLAPAAPLAGDTESSRSGVTRADGDGDADDFVSGLLSPALTSFAGLEPAAETANAQPATITAAAVPAVAAIVRCRSRVAPTRPGPPKLPKNDTAPTPQRLVSSLILPGDANGPATGTASVLLTVLNHGAQPR
jgi:hypothetical protein